MAEEIEPSEMDRLRQIESDLYELADARFLEEYGTHNRSDLAIQRREAIQQLAMDVRRFRQSLLEGPRDD